MFIRIAEKKKFKTGMGILGRVLCDSGQDGGRESFLFHIGVAHQDISRAGVSNLWPLGGSAFSGRGCLLGGLSQCHHRDKHQLRALPHSAGETGGSVLAPACLPACDQVWIILAHSQKRLPAPDLVMPPMTRTKKETQKSLRHCLKNPEVPVLVNTREIIY